MDHNPSAWPRRIAAAAVALAASAIAAYLGFCQAGLVAHAWEPLFGDGTRRILHSSVARLLPIPDALLGMAAYLVEAGLELAAGSDRWRESPGITGLNMALVSAMALASVLLVLAQALLFHAWCTLCLVSAVCSFLVFGLAWPELRALASLVRRSGA